MGTGVCMYATRQKHQLWERILQRRNLDKPYTFGIMTITPWLAGTTSSFTLTVSQLDPDALCPSTLQWPVLWWGRTIWASQCPKYGHLSQSARHERECRRICTPILFFQKLIFLPFALWQLQTPHSKWEMSLSGRDEHWDSSACKDRLQICHPLACTDRN